MRENNSCIGGSGALRKARVRHPCSGCPPKDGGGDGAGPSKVARMPGRADSRVRTHCLTLILPPYTNFDSVGEEASRDERCLKSGKKLRTQARSQLRARGV